MKKVVKMSIFSQSRWSPYIIGTCLGVLYCATYYYMHELIGISMSFMRVVGLIEHYTTPNHAAHSLFFKQFIENKPYIDWQLALVVSIFFGSLLSSLLSGSRTYEDVPSIWKKYRGPSRSSRYIWAFLGGILVVFGARIAGGGTYGFGLAYGLQLAIVGWFFLISLFVAGIIFASFFYK